MAAANDPELSRAPWRKSSYSGNGNNCVEVSAADGRIAVRDTTDPDGAIATFNGKAWQRFTARVKHEEA